MPPYPVPQQDVPDDTTLQGGPSAVENAQQVQQTAEDFVHEPVDDPLQVIAAQAMKGMKGVGPQVSQAIKHVKLIQRLQNEKGAVEGTASLASPVVNARNPTHQDHAATTKKTAKMPAAKAKFTAPMAKKATKIASLKAGDRSNENEETTKTHEGRR